MKKVWFCLASVSIVMFILLASCQGVFSSTDPTDTPPVTPPVGSRPAEYYLLTDKAGKDGNSEFKPDILAFSGTVGIASVTSGGADNTKTYITVTGTGAEDWAAGGWQPQTSPIDLSKYNTLVFYAKSATPTKVKFAIVDKIGDKDEVFPNYPEISRSLTDKWQKYEISFTDLETNGKTIASINFVLAGNKDTVDIDEVYLTNISAPTDTTAPTLNSVTASGGTKTVKLTFSEAVQFGTGGKTDGTGFTVKTGTTSGSAQTANKVTVAAISAEVLTLTLEDALKADDYLVVSFANNAISDKATSPNAFATGDSPEQRVTAALDTTAPTLNSIKANGGTNTVVLTFSEAVQFGTGAMIEGTGFTVKTGATSGSAQTAKPVRTAAIRAEVLTLTLDDALNVGDYLVVSFAYNAINDKATPPNAFAAGDSPEQQVTAALDTTAPTLNSVAANGGTNTVKLTFSEAVQFGNGGNTDGTGFTVKTGTTSGSAQTANAVTAAAISAKVLTLTLENALKAGEYLVVTFADNAISDKDTAPNALAAGDSPEQQVTAALDKTAPTLDGVVASGGTKTVVLAFSEAVQFGNGHNKDSIVVHADGNDTPTTTNIVTDASFNGDKTEITLTLTNDVVAGEYVMVTPGAGSLTDSAGNEVVAKAYQAVIPDPAYSGGASPNVANTDPAPDSGLAIKIYSDVADASFKSVATKVNTNPDWGQTTTSSEVDLSGNKVIKLDGLNYQGLTFDALDISPTALTQLSFDYWTGSDAKFKVFLIQSAALAGANAVEISVAVDPEKGAWKRFTLDLSGFTTRDKVDQIKFETVGQSAGVRTTVFIDNIYLK